MTDKTPNPGSKEAIEQGCKCPILDNHHGWGSIYGEGVFWISKDCPLHGKTTSNKTEGRSGEDNSYD